MFLYIKSDRVNRPLTGDSYERAKALKNIPYIRLSAKPLTDTGILLCGRVQARTPAQLMLSVRFLLYKTHLFHCFTMFKK